MIFRPFSAEDDRRVEAGDRTGDIGRNVAGELQVEIASAADPQEGREVAEIVAGIDRFMGRMGL